jgi:uncharacterized membrane protein
MTGAVASSPRARVVSVDLLRGLVMMIMALDHARDFVHAGAMAFQPENLAQTTPAIFFTRWITHICAPAFMLCAGLGAWFRLQRGGSTAALSWFLVTRGLWLIVLEFTLVRLSFFFNFDNNLIFLLVFWALGLSMIALALLVHLPWRVLLVVSVGMIVLHHLTDGIPPARFGAFAWLWQVLHARGLIATGGPNLLVAYPLVPWIGVMAAGFCLGRVYLLPDDRRRAWLSRLGIGMIVAFVVLRWLNAYGDPSPWAAQNRGPVFTLLSFLNTTKYPPSLLFLLMTLGPALVLLALFDRARPRDGNPLLVFGRTPLFYFVVHLPLIHAVAIALTWLRYGAAPFLFTPPPTLGTARNIFPPDYGWDLWVAYAVAAGVVLALYPACRWLARIKAQRHVWWTGYV